MRNWSVSKTQWDELTLSDWLGITQTPQVKAEVSGGAFVILGSNLPVIASPITPAPFLQVGSSTVAPLLKVAIEDAQVKPIEEFISKGYLYSISLPSGITAACWQGLGQIDRLDVPMPDRFWTVETSAGRIDQVYAYSQQLRYGAVLEVAWESQLPVPENGIYKIELPTGLHPTQLHVAGALFDRFDLDRGVLSFDPKQYTQSGQLFQIAGTLSYSLGNPELAATVIRLSSPEDVDVVSLWGQTFVPAPTPVQHGFYQLDRELMLFISPEFLPQICVPTDTPPSYRVDRSTLDLNY